MAKFGSWLYGQLRDSESRLLGWLTLDGLLLLLGGVLWARAGHQSGGQLTSDMWLAGALIVAAGVLGLSLAIKLKNTGRGDKKHATPSYPSSQ